MADKTVLIVVQISLQDCIYQQIKINHSKWFIFKYFVFFLKRRKNRNKFYIVLNIQWKFMYWYHQKIRWKYIKENCVHMCPFIHEIYKLYSLIRHRCKSHKFKIELSIMQNQPIKYQMCIYVDAIRDDFDIWK